MDGSASASNPMRTTNGPAATGRRIGDSARTCGTAPLLRQSPDLRMTIDDDLGGTRPFSDPAAARGDVTIVFALRPDAEASRVTGESLQ